MTSRSPLEPVLPSFLACLRKTKPKFTLPKCDRPGQSRFLAHHPLKRNETSRNQVAKKCRKRVSFSRMTDVSYSKFQNLSDSDCRDKRCHWSHLFRHTLDDAAAHNKEEGGKKSKRKWGGRIEGGANLQTDNRQQRCDMSWRFQDVLSLRALFESKTNSRCEKKLLSSAPFASPVNVAARGEARPAEERKHTVDLLLS